MISGLDLDETDSGFDPGSQMLFIEPDMAGFAERAPLKNKPGSTWNYTSGNTLILSRIIRDAVGGHAEGAAGFWLGAAQWRARWGLPRDSFFASGMLMQSVFVAPSERLVIARFGNTHEDPDLGPLVKNVIAAFKEGRPAS